MLPSKLRRSRHLSFFRQRQSLFLYHDLFGYLIELSDDLRELLDAFDGEHDTALLRDVFSERIAPSLLDDAIRSFVDFRCLVPPETDELELLLTSYPIKGPWITVWAGRRAVLGRCLRVPPRWHDFDALEQALWPLLDGNRCIASLSEELRSSFPSLDECETARRIAQWTHSEVQLCRVLDAPASFYRRSSLPAHALSTMPFERCVDDHVPAPTAYPGSTAAELAQMAGQSATQLIEYHQQITDPEAQFESLESTLSHLFRYPHPALGGQSYGTRCFEHLRSEGLWKDSVSRVLEIGGGLGFFAEALLDALQANHVEQYQRCRYTLLDLSPSLSRAQQSRLFAHPNTTFVLGDAETVELAAQSFELVLSNEVLADLRHSWVLRGTPDDAQLANRWEDPERMLEDAEDAETDAETDAESDTLLADAQSLELIQRYGLELSSAPRRFLFNVGALRLLERIWTLLAPGGCAWLSEFGDRWRYPVECLHLDHAEVSIHFGHMLQVAEKLGFEAELVDVFDALGFDGEHEVLASTQSWWRNFCTLLAERGIHPKKLAYTRQSLHSLCAGHIDLDELESLRWHRLEERVMGLQPREFKALLLRKPARSD